MLLLPNPRSQTELIIDQVTAPKGDHHTLGIISTPRLPICDKKIVPTYLISTPRVQVPINGKAVSMPEKSRLALYRARVANGFEIDFLSCIQFQTHCQISKGGGGGGGCHGDLAQQPAAELQLTKYGTNPAHSPNHKNMTSTSVSISYEQQGVLN